MGSIGQNSTFLEHCHVAYQIIENHECSNMVANILPAEPAPIAQTLGMGSIGQNSTCSEHGHVAYQINGNHEMQQHGSKCFARRTPLPPPPPPSSTTLGDGFKRSKFNFSEHGHVAYQIYWNHEMKQHGSKYLAGRCPPPPPLTLGSKLNFFRTRSFCISN